MKILRVFDSLKFVRAMFVAVVAIFAFAPAHADTTAIQSVIAYGKTEQNGTPTPANPVPIMTNNGELTVAKNLFDATKLYGMYLLTDTGQVGSASENYGLYRYFDVKPNTTYTFSYVSSSSNQYRRVCGYDNTGTFTELLLKVARSQGGVAGDSIMLDFTTGATTTRIAISTIVEDTDIMLREKKSVYANGLTETIRDAAGHKATAEMLLSAGDYKDEQNITTGAITRKVGVKVLDGSENWVVVSGADYFRLDGMFEDTIPYASDNPAIVCSHFVGRQPKTAASGMNDKDIKLGYTSTYNRLYLKYYNMTSADDLKQWLAEQYAAGTPVIVVYPLATETTESVTAQSLTTAPVRQTLGAIMNMPIKTILTDNSEIMSGAEELIKIATTKYNEESFTDVQDTLTGVFNAVDTVVTQTMSQAQAIDTIANNKQTRPDETCPVGKNCLLVEDEQGVPHWYVIANADDAFPTYTELQYIRLANGAFITTNIYPNQDTEFLVDFQHEQDALKWLFGTRSYPADASNGQNPINKFALQVFSTSNGGVWMQFDNTTNLEYGTTTVASNAASRLARHQCGIKNQRVWCDGNFIAWSSNGGPTNISNFTATNPLVIGGVQTSTGYSSSTFIGKIYGATDLVPCRRDTDSAVGLCRTSTGDFFGNSAGVGTITAGPEI